MGPMGIPDFNVSEKPSVTPSGPVCLYDSVDWKLPRPCSPPRNDNLSNPPATAFSFRSISIFRSELLPELFGPTMIVRGAKRKLRKLPNVRYRSNPIDDKYAISFLIVE